MKLPTASSCREELLAFEASQVKTNADNETLKVISNAEIDSGREEEGAETSQAIKDQRSFDNTVAGMASWRPTKQNTMNGLWTLACSLLRSCLREKQTFSKSSSTAVAYANYHHAEVPQPLLHLRAMYWRTHLTVGVWQGSWHETLTVSPALRVSKARIPDS